MRRALHRFTGHHFRKVCRLCVEVRFHIGGCEHELRCSCGARKPVSS